MAHPLPRRLSLLASSSLVATSLLAGVGAFGVAALAPGQALAACSGENTANVVCDAANPATAGTVVTDYVNAVPDISARVFVNSGAAVTTGGLTVTQSGDVGELLVYVDDPAGITNLAGAGVVVSNTTGGQTTFINLGGPISGAMDGVIVTTGAAALPSTSVGISTGAINANGSGVLATSNGVIGIDVTGDIVAGVYGVSAQGAGDGIVNVGIGANVTGGTTGVQAINSGTGSVVVTSVAGTTIRGDADYGIYGSSAGDVAMVLNGDVGTLANPTGNTGINAISTGGGIASVISNGTVISGGGGISTATVSGQSQILNSGSVTANGGNGLDATTSSGSVNISNSGDITAIGGAGISAFTAGTGPDGALVINATAGSITSSFTGISASNVGAGNAGLIFIQNVGTITANTSGFGGFGIYAQQAGDGGVTIQSAGAITGSAETGIFIAGNGAGSAALTVVANGAGIGSEADEVGNTGIGVFQFNAASIAPINIFANGSAGIYATQYGIDARNSGSGDVKVSVGAANPIVTTGVGSRAINTVSGVGATDIDVVGAITSGGIGIAASVGDGDLTIDTQASATISAVDDAINVASTGGASFITTNGAMTSTAGDGVNVTAFAASDVTVINSGAITANGNGVYAVSQGGLVTIVNSAAITANTGGIGAYGLAGVSNTGKVAIQLDAGGSIAGTAFTGIFGQTDGSGDVVIVNNGGGGIGTAGDYIDDFGVDAETVGVGAGDDVLVILNGTAGIFAATGGVRANAHGAGDVTVQLGGANSITTSDAAGYGVSATSNGGAILVSTTTSTPIISGGTGITTLNAGAGTTSITAGGNVTGAGAGLSGIYSEAATGAIVINTGNGATVAGTAGSGVRARSAGGSVVVNVGAGGVGVPSSVVTGLGAGGAGWVVDLNNAPGGTSTLNLASNGVIRSSDATTGGYDDLAIRFIGGAAAINNAGRINGVVNAGGASSLVFNNSSFNSWHTTGTSTFTAGADLLNNTGAIFTAAGGVSTTIDFGAGADTFANTGLLVVGEPALAASTLDLTGLETWNNSGRIVFGSSGTTLTALSDGQINDRILAAGTTFNGSGSSRLVMDASLGATVQTGCATLTAADCLGLTGGSTTGVTQIRINDIGGASSGALNTAGIVLVDVSGAGTTAATNFVLDPTSTGWRADANSADGVIDKGLFFYDLVLDGKQHKLVGLPDSDVFEFSTIGTAAQSAWYTTTGVWLDRQADLRQQLDGIDGSGAGVWMKINGSAAERDRTSSYNALGATYSFDTSYKQDTVALIGGVDIMGGGSGKAWVVGGQIGYVDSDVSYDASTTATSLKGMTLGLYGTWVSGSFFVDGIINANRLDYDHQNVTLAPVGSNIFSGQINSLGVQIEGGWSVPLGANGFFEPLATVSYLTTDIDSVAVPGSVIQWDDQTSLRASLGGRLGLNADLGGFSTQWAVTARYWNEFEGDNGLTVKNGGANLDVRDDFSGSFGELGASINVFSGDERFSSFLNIGSKFNGDYTSAEASLGIRWRW